MRQQSQLDDLFDRGREERVEGIDLLRDIADTVELVESGDCPAKKLDRSADRDNAQQRPDQGGFAGAVGTGDDDIVAPFDLETDVCESSGVAIGRTDFVEPN